MDGIARYRWWEDTALGVAACVTFTETTDLAAVLASLGAEPAVFITGPVTPGVWP